MAVAIDSICVATTDRVGSLIRLNSSKQPQSPLWQRPLKIFAISLNVYSGEQFVTTTYKPRVRPRSFTVSVLPVPAGPAGEPPKFIPKA